MLLHLSQQELSLKRPEARKGPVAFTVGLAMCQKMQTMQIFFFFASSCRVIQCFGAAWYEKAQDETLPSPTHDNVQIPQGNLALKWVG